MLQRCLVRPSHTRPTCALNAHSALGNIIKLPANSPFSTTPLSDDKKATNIKWHESIVSREQKEVLLGQRGCVLWFTGLSGSGKSTVACTLEHALVSRGRTTAQLDGDNVRHGLNCNLGFSPEDREENIRRVGEVAKLFADNGILTLASFISPYRKDRERVRQLLRDGDFVEIYMKIPLEVCEARDPKGLYKKARAGQIKCFTGIDDPYEEPVNPELTLTTHDAFGHPMSPEHMAAEILNYLQERGYLRPPVRITTVDEPQLEWYI